MLQGIERGPRVAATRPVTFRDFVIFQLKLAIDGLKDLLVMQVSVVALIVDFFAGEGHRPRWFYSVVRVSERFDAWLNLHGVVERLQADRSDDGLFGASDAGSDTLLGQIEEMVRGGDVPRAQRPAA
jgi:hypothetical protein